MRKIIKVTSTGTPFGFSYWDQVANGCARKAILAKATGIPKIDATKGMFVGSAFACFMEMYRGGDIDETHRLELEVDEEVYGEVDESWKTEALRIITWYRENNEPHDMGKTLGTEVYLELKRPDGLRYTGAVDAIVDTTDIHIPHPLIGSPEPGIWLVDDKTVNTFYQPVARYYRNRLQFAYYGMLAKHSGYDIKGTLVNIVIKAKTPQRYVLCVPLKEAQMARTLSMLNKAHTILFNDALCMAADNSECFSYHSECVFSRTGLCNRK